MSKEILWVTVGTTDGIVRDEDLERVRDAVQEGHEEDYHIYVTSEELSLFDLDDLESHVDEVRKLVESVNGE